MSFRKPYHTPFRKLIPPFTLTDRQPHAIWPTDYNTPATNEHINLVIS